MKQDEFVEAAFSLEQWLEENWQTVAKWAVALVVVGVLIGGFFWWNESRTAAAKSLLAEGMGHLDKAGSEEGTSADFEAALESFEKAAGKGGPASDTATYFQGVALSRLGRHDEAAEILSKAANSAVTLEAADAARLARVDALMAAGKAEEGSAALRELADGEGAYAGYALHRLAELAEEQGNDTEAQGLYQRFIDDFPNDPLAVTARQKLEE
ncbi:hypothetical protein ABI59_03260 [Acidobacteria bacterium Mor1]|nr:hypothetical protein ABI59_03260 [Acidobacteria bacterium Mor1]